ncbi:hypothetical protein EPN42_04650 [bacterium]|nr:MAG: hypothetical protein EPN42_04650 [bacterium]
MAFLLCDYCHRRPVVKDDACATCLAAAAFPACSAAAGNSAAVVAMDCGSAPHTCHTHEACRATDS